MNKKTRPKNGDEFINEYYTNIITNNKTLPDGTVVNENVSNAEYARKRVDEIRL